MLLAIEIGVVGGEEDGVDGRNAERSRLYSTPADARAVVEALGGGRGRYLLAATFGNVHGRHLAGNVELRPALLAELQAAAGDQLPARGRGHAEGDGQGEERTDGQILQDAPPCRTSRRADAPSINRSAR